MNNPLAETHIAHSVQSLAQLTNNLCTQRYESYLYLGFFVYRNRAKQKNYCVLSILVTWHGDCK